MKLIIIILLLHFCTSPPVWPANAVAFPNKDQPPTAADQFPQFANYNFAPLSKALFELDPERQLRKEDFLNVVKFSLYSMTRGEISLVFDFADGNNDDLLSQTEWVAFTRLYVYPFEACDSNKDYHLNNDEFKNCYDLDPKFKSVKFTKTHEQLKYDYMQRIIRHRRDQEVNFFGYMMIKNAMYAWEKCHSASYYIDKQNFRCALSLGLPDRYSLSINYDQIYDTAIELGNNIELTQLDFINYLRIYDISYAFVVLSHPKSSPFIEKQTFINNLKREAFPTSFQTKDVEDLFYLINNHPYHDVTEMTFKSFAFFYNLECILNNNIDTVPKSITSEEILKIYKDPFLNNKFYYATVASTGAFTEKEYLEGSLILQNLRINQQEFFFKFKENPRPFTVDWNVRSNDNKLYVQQNHFVKENVVFRIMADMNKHYWDKKTFYRTFQLINFFVYMCEDIRWLVSQHKLVKEMPNLYDKVEPQINLNQRRNLKFYKYLPENFFLDLLTFLKYENFLDKIHLTNISDSSTIPEHLIMLVFKDYSMDNFPRDTLDTCLKGFDSLRRRTYDIHKTPINILLSEAVTGELVRNKFDNNYHKIPPTTYASRVFPEELRRSEVSPLV